MIKSIQQICLVFSKFQGRFDFGNFGGTDMAIRALRFVYVRIFALTNLLH